MGFKFSDRSRSLLVGVEPALVGVAERALFVSTVDFGITCGLRTQEEQDRLFAEGRTQARVSKHSSGRAVDVAAWVDGTYSWEHRHYVPIARAFAWAATEARVKVRWGAAWTFPDIRFLLALPDGIADARGAYEDEARRAGRKPFVDAPHFELN